MRRIIIVIAIIGLSFTLTDSESVAGRRGGGGRGGGGRGGFSGGSGSGGGGVVNSYGGGAGSRSSTPIDGPRGGSGTAGSGGGSYTTKGGSTIDYKAAGAGGTTAGGVSGGKYVGGIQVTTPGGKEVTRVGKGGGAVGPEGNAIAGKSGVTVGTGPEGSFATKYKGGVAVGPQGAVAGSSKAGIATGPEGTVAGATRAGAAVGPYGAVAGRTTVAAGAGGTYYRSATAIRGQGVYVRQGVVNYPCFRPGWYAQYPGAWFAAGWAAGAVWHAATWGTCASYCGCSEAPVYYDYGTNVVYEDDGVYVDGEKTASTEQYAQQATALADAGRDAKASKEGEWLPLGVFAMVQGDEKSSNHLFQLSVNKDGVIRGNYYDAVTDSTSLVYGSVDKKTQRAAWTVGDRKTPVYEVGFANLTKDDSTMLVHYGTDRTQQFTLIRIEKPEDEKTE
ncbi:MAG: protocadherin [Planctomycetes bacterium]|nr:protocadherin [Planctomycetota bacterium]